jgi:phosphatidylglycerol:prolipoprotein diacylglycerol transferase
MRPTLFHLGDLAVPSFWVTAILGFVAALVVVRRDLQWRGADSELAYDIILYAYIGGWVGARLFLLPTAWSLLIADPIGVLLSGSGWVWYGGVVGGLVAIVWLARQKQLPFLYLADVSAPALAIGLAIGRIGCQLAGDGDYGVPTDLPWGMSYPHGVVPTTERVHPTPVYETLACLAIFAYLWRHRRQSPPTGDLFGRYLVLAGTERFLIELVRRNPAWLFGLTTAQWFSVGFVMVGAFIVRRVRADTARAPAAAVH